MRILQRRKLFSFAVSLGGGMAMARLLSPNFALVLAAAGGLAALALYLHIRRAARRFFAGAAAVLFFLSVFFAGAGYYLARDGARPSFETAYGVCFEGRVAGSPYLDENGERFVCALDDVRIEDEKIGYSLRLYLRGDQEALAAIACGQIIAGEGHLYAPGAARNPHAFDFGEYLWHRGFAGYVTAKAGDVTISGAGGGLSNMLLVTRKAISARIYAAYEDNPEMVLALAIGATRDMDSDLRADFVDSGVAHLLAVSGMHITLIAMALTFLLARLIGARAATAVSLVAIFAYAAVVGFMPSVTRAVVMYAVLCGAPLVGRTSDGSTRLSLAFIVILLINPLSLADAGFVLSFSASAGLIWLTPPLLKLTRADKLREKRGWLWKIGYYFASLAVSTTAAQLATFPALALFYGSMPTYSILVNILLVPYTLGATYLALLGILFPILAPVPDFFLTLLGRAVGFFARLPYGEIPVRPPHPLVWVLLLTVSVAVSDMGRMREKWKPYAVLALPLLLALSGLWAFDSGCVITFLDVGQGDAAVIRLEGKTYVVDVGEDGSEVADFVSGEDWDIDALFLSHPHSDHAGGLGELMAACDIEAIYVPAGWFDCAENRSIVAESEAALAAGILWIELSPGDEVALTDRAMISVIEAGAISDDAINDMSLILLLDYGEAQALFTGDAEVRTGPDIDVLKVGHHGARDATDKRLIESLTPEVAVISVGVNAYGHPSERVIGLIEEAGGDVYRTDEGGAITVTMDYDGEISVETFLKEDGR